MREIVLDTETTGLDPATGDRIVEIGAVELVNHVPTGNYYHQYINPERDMPAEAFNVHGLSAEFLADYPVFAAVAQEFLDFIGDGILVIHNAQFDMKFINAELSWMERDILPMERVIDSLALARKRHPMGPNSLDALCRRYGIDNSRREKHGALLDSELLADVYIELIGGRQTTFSLTEERATVVVEQQIQSSSARQRPQPLPLRLTSAELELHAKMVEGLGDNALWRAKN
ncbi:MAG: DNA polymerase III subunit epsilon [Anderseniella sp.]|nr:DNA polymerase III subunit epsilon [Anderseniella sp.]